MSLLIGPLVRRSTRKIESVTVRSRTLRELLIETTCSSQKKSGEVASYRRELLSRCCNTSSRLSAERCADVGFAGRNDKSEIVAFNITLRRFKQACIGFVHPFRLQV